MIKTARQLKDKVRNLTMGLTGPEKSEKAQMLIRNFLMERLLERVSVSEYRHNFILKGGMLVASYTGLEMRSTMDIDTTVKALPLLTENVKSVLEEIMQIDLGDHVAFEIKSCSKIMEDFDYPGIRVMIVAKLDVINQAIKIDISTDDVITPDAVAYEYKLMFEDRTIPLRTYNLETLLAEKLQTIIARGGANTRIRDYYDIYVLTKLREKEIDVDTLKAAFEATSQKRGTLNKVADIYSVLEYMHHTPEIIAAWDRYKKTYYYVGDVSWDDVIESINALSGKIILPAGGLDDSENEEMTPSVV